MTEIDDAADLFEAYHGFEPQRGDLAELERSDIILRIGEVNAISYTVTLDGKCETFYHEFDSRPVLTVSSDGRQIYILAGEYEFTKDGIEG